MRKPPGGCRPSTTAAVPPAAEPVLLHNCRQKSLPEHLFGSFRTHSSCKCHQCALEADQVAERLLDSWECSPTVHSCDPARGSPAPAGTNRRCFPRRVGPRRSLPWRSPFASCRLRLLSHSWQPQTIRKFRGPGQAGPSAILPRSPETRPRPSGTGRLLPETARAGRG